MKIQSWILACLSAMFSIAGAAADKPAPDAAKTSASPEAVVEQRAEALTEQQIKQSHDIPGLAQLAQIYGAQNDNQRLIWTLERVSELMPNSGDLKLQLAMADAKAGDKTKAYDVLLHMQMQGFGYEIGDDPRFEPVHGTRVWDYIVANLAVNAKQFGEGKVAFDLPKGDHLYETIAFDPKRKKLLFGSMREGGIAIADDSGKASSFVAADPAAGPWGIDALAVDAAHSRLYAASAATPLYRGFNADNANRSAVFEFDLASGKQLHKYTLPQEAGQHRLNLLAVTKDGQIYAGDGAARELFKVEGDALRPLIANPHLTGISALTVSDDGKTLYFADYALGIFGYDLTKGKAFELAHNQESLVLGGIDDLLWYDGHLVAIEGGMVPSRIMRLKLAADGRSITGAMPLDVAHPAFAALGQGAVAGDSLYFIANSQKSHYDDNGVLVEADKLEAPHVFRSNLRFAWGQSGVGSSSVPVQNGPTKDGKPVVMPAHGRSKEDKPAPQPSGG
ncbi:MAG TPA: hypothetical protein VFB32_18400 [Rudaea sp.]|nr:hypothetical protein [Rudaea sp.]